MGLPDERFVHFDTIPKELKCTICGEVFERPVGTPCQHVFCAKCIGAWVRDHQGTCPIDRQPITPDQLIPHTVIANLVDRYEVYCEHHPAVRQSERLQVETETEEETRSEPECQWHGPLEEYAAHVAKHCPCVLVPCPFADALGHDGHRVLRRDLEKHREECPSRSYTCSKCGAQMSLGEREAHDANTCPEASVSCPHCGVQMARKYLASRHAQECPNMVLQCPVPGCETKCQRRQLEDHFRDGAAGHTLLLVAQLNAQREMIHAQDRRIQQLERMLHPSSPSPPLDPAPPSPLSPRLVSSHARRPSPRTTHLNHADFFAMLDPRRTLPTTWTTGSPFLGGTPGGYSPSSGLGSEDGRQALRRASLGEPPSRRERERERERERREDCRSPRGPRFTLSASSSSLMPAASPTAGGPAEPLAPHLSYLTRPLFPPDLPFPSSSPSSPSLSPRFGTAPLGEMGTAISLPHGWTLLHKGQTSMGSEDESAVYLWNSLPSESSLFVAVELLSDCDWWRFTCGSGEHIVWSNGGHDRQEFFAHPWEDHTRSMSPFPCDPFYCGRHRVSLRPEAGEEPCVVAQLADRRRIAVHLASRRIRFYAPNQELLFDSMHFRSAQADSDTMFDNGFLLGVG